MKVLKIRTWKCCLIRGKADSCHGHEYQHAANKEIAGICRRICAILELKKEEEITRVCAGNNSLYNVPIRTQALSLPVQETELWLCWDERILS